MIKWAMGGAVIAACLGYLVFSATGATAQYYVTIPELKAHPPTQDVRVLGTIKPGIVTSQEGHHLLFSAADGPSTMQVEFTGTVPEMFEPGIQVVVDGRPGANGVFQAVSLQTKCPSHFAAAAPKPPART